MDLHPFSMSDNGGDVNCRTQPVYFGIFREAHHNYEPRTKAYALQEVCGGTKPLK